MNKLKEMIELSAQQKPLHAEELPPIDLYIDQLITLISQRSECSEADFEDRPLSKMMVNNYSKAGLLGAMKGKRYSREHIVRLLTVCAMKGTLSISEIKSVLDKLYSDPEFGSGELFGCYEKGLMAQSNCRDELSSLLCGCLEEPANDGERFAALMAVCAMSDTLSRLAKRMAAEYFPAEDKKKSRRA